MFENSTIYQDLKRELDQQKKKIQELETFKQSAQFQSARSRHSGIHKHEDEDEDISFINDNGNEDHNQMSPPSNNDSQSKEFELKDER